MANNVPCAGIIVFDKDNTVLVNTEKGNYSFPKGKREKGETSLETAWRELQEETGLTKDYVKLIDDFCLDEQSRNGNLSIRYYVGHLTKPYNTFTFDKNELENVQWITVDNALKLEKFVDKRKEILKQAYQKSQ